MALDAATHEAITRAAREHGIDPAVALAIAERESSFNVHGGSGSPLSSARGLFQLLNSERRQYGGDSSDPYEQSSAWANYIGPHREHMAKVLGREPSGPELYFSHLIGPGRAAKIAAGQIHPDTPIQDVMTPRELAANPFMVRAGTAGGLFNSVSADMTRRIAKYGGETSAPGGGPPEAPTKGFNFSRYGELVDEGAASQPMTVGTQPSGGRAGFSQYGELVQQVADRGDPRDFTSKYNTALSPVEERRFKNWAAKQSQTTGRDIGNDTYDYDLRGYWKAHPDFNYSDPSQHLTDDFKKPNHPTFSAQSQYHGTDGNEGGQWKKQGDGSWSFAPGSTNLQMHGPQRLQDYFNRSEPGNKLELPAKKMGLGYDPNLDEMNSGYSPAADRALEKADEGLIKPVPGPSNADSDMEKQPAKIPKQPLSQVPENELDDDRPNFYQRQFPVNQNSNPDFSKYGEPVQT
jgi:hypothetical protein